MDSTRKWLCVAILALVTSGCATTTVRTRCLMPARSLAMQEKQRVLVQGFKGRRGQRATTKVRAAISQGGYHALVEARSSAARKTALDRAAESGDYSVLGAGDLEGATVIVEGRTEDDRYDVRRYRDVEEEQVCDWYDDDGFCQSYSVHRFTVFRVEETCVAGLSGRIIRVSDNHVVLDRLEEAEAHHWLDQRDRPPRPRGTVLCNRPFDEAVEAFTRFLTPSRVLMDLTFRDMENDDGATEEALKRVRASRFAEAQALMEDVVTLAALEGDERAWARYNLGKVLFARGDFEGCAEQMEMARLVLDDSTVSDWVARCRDYLQ